MAKKHTPYKIIKRVLTGLGIVILSAVITFAVIKIMYKTPVTTKAVSATELIKKYSDGYKLDGYAKSASISDSVISYKLSDTAYTVQISSRDNVQFTKTENSTTADITHATDSGKAFLTSYGFKVVANQASTDQTQLVYDSPSTVCKLFSSFDPSKKASGYGLVCTDMSALVTERDAIKTLLPLYTQTGGATDFKNVVRTTYTEGNKDLSLLSINSQDASKAPYTLIFAAIDGKWSYIGSRVTPSIDAQDSFQLSSALKAAVNDPKYDGFLAKYIY